MLRLLIVFGIFFGLLSNQAEARTIRYEFDVVESVIDYQALWKNVGIDEDPTISATEYAAFIAAYHPVGRALGLSGPITLEVVERNDFPWQGDLFCVSGFLCESGAFQGSRVSSDLTGFSAYNTAHEWSLTAASSGFGELSFFEDGAIVGDGSVDGVEYSWWAPRAEFTLINVYIFEVSSVPLPASASLLAMGLLGLGIGARRRRGIS